MVIPGNWSYLVGEEEVGWVLLVDWRENTVREEEIYIFQPPIAGRFEQIAFSTLCMSFPTTFANAYILRERKLRENTVKGP